jgi:LCP family protein required for cell wall assembly
MLVVGSLGAYGFYAQLDGNLNVVNAFGGLKNRPPAGATGVENILLLGSQTRDGQVGGRGLFGTDPGTDLSDNLILVHLDASHTHATVVSIPRDLQVYEPACKSRFGSAIVPAIPDAIIDGAMNQGGPACAIATVEHLTDIRIDHFVRFTFNSFRDMTDILGGVEVCLRQAVNDPYSHLHMSAGRHLVTGNEALAFVRTRHGVGNGGDLGRIELQQQFISSLIQKIQSNGTLTNPLKLFDIAKVATNSLTVDPGLGSISALLKQGYGLRSLHSSNVTFITMPNTVDPTNINRLLTVQPAADDLWQMLKAGQLWRGKLPTTSPSQVNVTVLNGTGQANLASTTATELRKLGYNVTTTGNAAATASTTVTYAGSAGGMAAYTLSNALTATPTATDTLLSQATAAQTDGTTQVTLTLGTDFTGVKSPSAHSSKSSSSGSSSGGVSVQTRNAGANICSGVPNAFNG